MAGDSASTAGSRPIILGHRGASADAPENTLAAFRLAAEQGADGVELDVWRCRTGEVVVHHDADTLRTTGVARRITASAWSELRILDAGAWKGERFQGERIPLLAEVLEALPGAVVNVELKSTGWPDLALAAAAARVVRDAGASRRCLVSSFDLALLAAFRRAAPEVATGVLFEGRAWWWRAEAGVRGAGTGAVHPPFVLATDARVRAWRRRGLEVNVWTVDDGGEAARLAAAGATALITNRPAAARAALRASQ
jgi:glycerophosphoryl diester phosphodiesterase